jgi:hypothetical protein
MKVKLTWSYATTPAGQAPNKFVIQHKPATGSTWTTQATFDGANAVNTICSNGSCTYTYPSDLPDNVAYNFQVVTDCSEGSTTLSNTINRINVLCPSFTPSATSNSISYSFSGATGTDVTGYIVELLLNGTVLESKPLASVAATISGTFSGNSTPNDGITDYTIASNTNYVVRVTVKSSGTDKVCTKPISTTNTPPCNSVTNLAGCICGEDCAEACS